MDSRISNTIFFNVNSLFFSTFNFSVNINIDSTNKFKIKQNLLIYNLQIQLDLLLDLIWVSFYPHKEKSFKFAISTDTE